MFTENPPLSAADIAQIRAACANRIMVCDGLEEDKRYAYGMGEAEGIGGGPTDGCPVP